LVEQLAVDSLGDFRSLWFNWCSAGINGYGRPLDLKGSPPNVAATALSCSFAVRDGRSQIAEVDEDLKHVAERDTSDFTGTLECGCVKAFTVVNKRTFVATPSRCETFCGISTSADADYLGTLASRSPCC
jgi:hypothetical protein